MTKIIALSTSTKFTGAKTIAVNIVIEIDYNSLPDNVIINDVAINNVEYFIYDLITVLDKNPNFIELTIYDFAVYKKSLLIF